MINDPVQHLEARDPWSESLRVTWQEAVDIWASGGWAMWAIAAVATIIFGMGVHVRLKLKAKGFSSVPESTWRYWINHPEEREGPIGRLLDYVTAVDSIKETSLYFDQVRMTEVAPFERDLKIMKICVSAAPLVGLLGTVTGMLATFAALASGSGGDKTMGMVASGISEALVTTETGLVVALPGLFFQYQLIRSVERYKAFLAHLETVCSQALYRRESDSVKLEIRREARALIRAHLQRAAS